MDEKEKKLPDEEEKKPDTPDTEKAEEKKDADGKPADKPDGDGQSNEADKPDKDKSEGNDGGTEGEKSDETTPEQPKLSAEDQLRAENLTLKTQLEAMKIGFTPDCMEDAVTLAEAIVKRDGTDITSALQSVAKKYPDWKSDGKDGEKSNGGFKVGADSPKDKSSDSDRLDKAFGIKKKN